MKYPCHTFKQYVITMAVMSVISVLIVLFVNGCGTTREAVASDHLPVIENYSNINTQENVSNFNLQIFTSEEDELIVPCYYWKMMRINKNKKKRIIKLR